KIDFLANGAPASADPTLLAQATYVDGLYRTLLGRPSDLGGLVGWVRFLRAGGSLGQVVQSLGGSDGHPRPPADTLYRAFFNQSPDPGGRAFWVGVFRSGAGEMDVIHMMLASSAYQALHAADADFISALFGDVLGRTVDPGSLAFWMQQLQNGVSRDA